MRAGRLHLGRTLGGMVSGGKSSRRLHTGGSSIGLRAVTGGQTWGTSTPGREAGRPPGGSKSSYTRPRKTGWGIFKLLTSDLEARRIHKQVQIL